ncbi:hypothetical protein Taro_008894 [Colocasia esculenta]|uniref:Mitotic-spindle organizing protein 1 n=1 Tax=Colocasia esculenta TaxID=4460 RepID=A0A843TYL8_COLES|nr:hypothetical protein [Colocasia esculenta]
MEDAGVHMDSARNAKESLDMAFQMSNILNTGLDRHTLSLLIALCDRDVNPTLSQHRQKQRSTNEQRTPLHFHT